MTSAARIRPLLLALLAMLTLWAAPALAVDDPLSGAKDNQAVAEPSGAGDSVIDLAFSVRETASDVIDETNTAVAYANCEACRAVAIAFQIVIVQGSPGTITPQNVAVAVNDQCPDCSTLAAAYQFVVGRGEPVEFTKRGLERLAAIRKELEKLEQSYGKLTNQQILARTDALATEVRDILANDLVPVDGDDKGDKRGPPINRDDAEQDDRGDPTATTTTPVAPEPDASEAPAPPPPTETAPPTQTDPAPDPSPDPVPTTTTAAP